MNDIMRNENQATVDIYSTTRENRANDRAEYRYDTRARVIDTPASPS